MRILAKNKKYTKGKDLYEKQGKKIFAILTMCIMLSSVLGVTDESIFEIFDEVVDDEKNFF